MRFPWAERGRGFVRTMRGGSWPRRLLRIVVLATVLGAGGVLYAWTGLFSVAASSGHSAITYWFLDFAKRNGVKTQALEKAAPPLDDPVLVLKGAGHYASGCAPCHGAPGKPPAMVALKMTPEPPYLPAKLDRWDNEELFWIVKHGIKFTGMPAWSALEREDEIWAMVSFLERLPTLDAAAYEKLAYGERARASRRIDSNSPPNSLHALEEPVGSALDNCARCHGADGSGRGVGAFPKLAGQNAAYLFESLRAYAKGQRSSGIMQPVASGLDEKRMRALAAHYADQEPSDMKADSGKNPALIERGKHIAERGIPARGIPSCRDCHGPDRQQRNPMYPQLAGQYADYLVLQLELFKEGTRGGTPYAHIMKTVTRRMGTEEMHAVAAYYASLHATDTASAR